MKISIAMATYNGERFLQEQLDSLARQTRLPDELVITDDGSSDRTVDIAMAFTETAPFAVHIYCNNQNLGFGDNFLKAASFCTGDWVAFCDQDDIWLEEKLSILSKYLVKRDVVLAVHSSRLADTITCEGQDYLKIRQDYLPNIAKTRIVGPLKSNTWWIPQGQACVVRRSLISDIPCQKRPAQEADAIEPCQPHDRWVFFLANILGNIAYVSQPLVIYRRHDKTVTGGHDSQKRSIVKKINKGRAVDYVALSNMADEWADSLHQLIDVVPREDWHRKIATGVWYYRNLAVWLELRARMYVAPSAITRLRIFLNLILKRAYGGRKWRGLGWKAFFKDFLVTVGVLGLVRNNAETQR